MSSERRGRGRRVASMAIALLTVLVLAVAPSSPATVFSANVRVNTWDILHPVPQVHPSTATDARGVAHVAWEDYRVSPTDPDIWYARSLDGGRTFGADRKISDAPVIPPSKQLFPSVAVSPEMQTENGFWPVVHVAWTDLRGSPGPGIYYARSVDGGASFGGSVRISEPSPPTLWTTYGEYIQAQIAYEGSGGGCHLHVVWSISNAAALPTVPDWAVYYTESDDCGATWGVPALVAWTVGPPPLVLRYGHDAAVSASADGFVGVAFAANPGVTGWDSRLSDVYFTWATRPFLYGGWSVPLQVNDLTGMSGAHNPTIAYQRNVSVQEPHLAWEDSRNMDPDPLKSYTWHDWDVYYTNRPGDVTTADVLVNERTGVGYTPYSEQSEPSIALDGWLNPRIAWTDWRADPQGWRAPSGYPHDADVYYAESHDHGLTFPPPNLRVNDDLASGPRENSRPSLFELSGVPGTFPLATYVAWQDERDLPGDYNVYFTGHADPRLDWCGTPGYVSDGVEPNAGTLLDTYTYMVRYRSAVGDAPAAGNPTVDIRLGGAPIPGSPFAMTLDFWYGSAGNWLAAGACFTFSTRLPQVSLNYTYTFQAEDVRGRDAAPLSGPGPYVLPRLSVDIAGDGAGGDPLIAVGWDTHVSLYSRLNGGTAGPYRTQDMGFPVDYVILSQDGAYLMVVGNDYPLTHTSGSHVRIFGPIIDPAASWPPLITDDPPHSIRGIGRPADMDRHGEFFAVGTGIADWDPQGVGTVYLYRRASPGAPPQAWNWNRWIHTLRFSEEPTHRYFAIGSVDGLPNTMEVGVFQVDPVLTRTWSGDVDDATYSVAMDANGDHLADGHGIGGVVYFRQRSGTNWDTTLWDDRPLQNVFSLSQSSDAAHLAGAASGSSGTGTTTFILWDATGGSRRWTCTYAPPPGPCSFLGTKGPTRVDFAVDTAGQFLVGAWSDHVYFWGSASGPASGPVPRSLGGDFDLPGPSADLAMTYEGAYSAVVDYSSHVSVYASLPGDGPGWDSLSWRRLIP